MVNIHALKRTRTVSIGVVAVLTVLTSLMTASAGSAAAVDARLQGTAKVTLKLTRDDLEPSSEGSELARKYKFSSSCSGDRACSKVDLKRGLSDGSFQQLTLKRVKKGVYKYDETSNGSYWCEEDGEQIQGTEVSGPLQTTVTISVTQAENGEATQIAVALKFVKPPYPGWNDPGCAALAESRGLKVGERPKQISKGIGKF